MTTKPSKPDAFDYTAAAELYPGDSPYKSSRVRYRRFDTVAEALQYAMEDMPAQWLRGAALEVDEDRFESADMRALYEADAYPLKRKSPQ